jgi:hypothetical protein
LWRTREPRRSNVLDVATIEAEAEMNL